MLSNKKLGIAEPGSDELIIVEAPAIVFTRRMSIVADMAAQILAKTEPSQRPAVVGRLLESGAESESIRKSSIAGRLIERQLEGFAGSFGSQLAAIFQAGGDKMEERILRALRQHEKDLIEWTTRFTDPASETGLPGIAARRLRQVSDSVLQQVNLLLTDGDTGALAKFAEKIASQIRESERNVLNALIAKQTQKAIGVYRGKTFEEALSFKLSQVGAATGSQVERVGDHLGVKRTRKGDHLFTLDPGQTGGELLRVAVEEKSHADNGQRFTFEAIKKECEAARANREAQAAVFVAESRETLPDGLSFGQVGRADYFVQFDPATGEDVALVAALYLARAAAIETVKVAGPGPVDRAAAKRLVDDIRERVERRARILSLHNSAVKAIHSATKAVDEDAEAILTALSRLDGLLVG